MSRAVHLARLERERLLNLERRTAQREEAKAMREGIAETVRLSETRGAAFAAPGSKPGERERPYRRQSGLDWLAGRGRLTKPQHAAGERYGALYRRVSGAASLPSTLNVKFGRGAPGEAGLSEVLAHAEGTAQASAALATLRARLHGQPALVSACDAICGQELTPREASSGDREAGKLEAVLIVALDILASAP